MGKETNIAPGQSIKLLSKSDSVDFTARPRGIVVGSGTITFVNGDDTTTAVADGVLATGVVHPISPKRINATGSTAVVYGVY